MKMYDRKLEDYYYSAIELKNAERKHPDFLKTYDTEMITDILRQEGIRVYKSQKITTTTKWRLTSPFFALLVIVLFILLPFKYLFTGSWYYDVKWIQNWSDKL